MRAREFIMKDAILFMQIKVVLINHIILIKKL
ncbi:MAG: hypothetical protein Ct9H90mP18_10260 [Gammaproteobacteria bacterium]|nr:MAG: hypothetical protein Ct9H90mP18_10260 [Gammaproteobacteria bacterium]